MITTSKYASDVIFTPIGTTILSSFTMLDTWEGNTQVDALSATSFFISIACVPDATFHCQSTSPTNDTNSYFISNSPKWLLKKKICPLCRLVFVFLSNCVLLKPCTPLSRVNCHVEIDNSRHHQVHVCS